MSIRLTVYIPIRDQETSMYETVESLRSKAETHKAMGGKVNIYRREHSDKWQCSTFLNGRNWRVSTHENSLGPAKVFAEDWYLGMRGKVRAGLLPEETRRQCKKFKEAAAKFLEEASILTHGQRGPTWLKQYELKLSTIILPFLGEKQLTEITPGVIQEYRIWRAQNCKTGRSPARSTVHKEIVCIRLVLKTASRHGWLKHLPDMSEPYKTSGKFTHRAWFSPEEYQKLYEATHKRAHQPRQKRFKWECEQLHDYVEFAINTGVRPDEAMRLQFRDVIVVDDEASWPDHPGNRSTWEARCRLLQEHRGCGTTIRKIEGPPASGWRARKIGQSQRIRGQGEVARSGPY